MTRPSRSADLRAVPGDEAADAGPDDGADAPPRRSARLRAAVGTRLPHGELQLTARTRRAGIAAAHGASRGYQRGLERMLTSTERVTSAAEGTAVLASDEHLELLSEQLQKVAIAVVPAMRIAGRGGRVLRVPSVLVASTALSAGMTVRHGVRELQVVAALLDHRIEQATGAPADPALVKALALAIYRDPAHPPSPDGGRLRFGSLGRRWVVRGAFGRDTGAAAAKALEAAERLDGAAQAARWAKLRGDTA